MKILELLGDRRIQLRDAESPRPRPGEVVVRMTASAICCEAWHYTSAHDPTVHPYSPGHEGVGVVEEVAGDLPLEIGQQVAVHGVWGCGTCEQCRAGRFTWCRNTLVRPGFHRERVVVPGYACLPIPRRIAPVDAALLTGCAFGLAHGTAKRYGPSTGHTIAIFGVGPVGLSQVVMQDQLGARTIAIDVNAYRLGLARACGAADAIDASAADFTDRLAALQVDGCIVCVRDAAMVAAALRVTRPGGQVLCVAEGLVLDQLEVSTALLRYDLALRGHWFWFACDLPEIIALFDRGLPIRTVLTHTFPLTDPQGAYETLASGTCGKVVLVHPEG